jgi:hypothetical protein
MKGLELENQGEPWRPAKFVPNDMTGNFDRQGQRKSHMLASLVAGKL